MLSRGFSLQLENLKAELAKKESELTALKINKRDYEDTKERFRELNSHYNIAITNQTEISNKVIEMVVSISIFAVATASTFKFASGTSMYIGFAVILLTLANTIWSAYRIHEKLSLAKDMKSTVLK